MSLLKALFPDIAAAYQEKQEKEKKAVEEKIRIKNELKNQGTTLLNNRIRQYNESVKFSAEATMPSNGDHTTMVYLTKNRILFTMGSINNLSVIDIPYEKVYDAGEYEGIPCGVNIRVLNKETGNIKSYYLHLGRVVNRNQLLNEMASIAGSRLCSERNEAVKARMEYENVCWKCRAAISSLSNVRCPECRMFICGRCGACFCNRDSNVSKIRYK